IVERYREDCPALARRIIELAEARPWNTGYLLFELAFLFAECGDDEVDFAQLRQRQRAGDFVHAKVQAQDAALTDFHSCAQRGVALVMNAKCRSIVTFGLR